MFHVKCGEKLKASTKECLLFALSEYALLQLLAEMAFGSVPLQ